jgi:hypothetical protein
MRPLSQVCGTNVFKQCVSYAISVKSFGADTNNFESVGILMIATNGYLERWFDTATGIEQHGFLKAKRVSIHLFTNRVDEAQRWGEINLRRVNLITHKIKGWGWPEATLFRYQFFMEASESISEKLLMYCDSDMLIKEDFENLLDPETWIGGIAFVQHPGFFRNSGIKGLIDYFINPRLLGPLVQAKIARTPGLGSWENSRSSTAYLELKQRKNYVHGAVWFGKRDPVMKMCKWLAENIRKDLSSGYIAKWHDESHLNCYLGKYGGSILSNELSGVSNYRHLNKFNSRIVTVEKSSGEGRKPTEFDSND